MWILVALSGCESYCKCAPEFTVPAGTAVGDEIVLDLRSDGVEGTWASSERPGALLEIRLGANNRHVVIPADVGDFQQTISLGAWDGGEVTAEVLEGTFPAPADPVYLRVDPAAAGTPVLGTYDTNWSNDTPLITYEEDGRWTWVFTDEDGGTGLIPTLLMARWGRPVDIEGLYDTESATIQTTDHEWVPFEGPWEGTHPLFEVVTYNGLIGPYTDAPYQFSPVPVAFTTQDGTIQRERVLDDQPWVLAAAWAEAWREGLVVPDGGQADMLLGLPQDYIFLDFFVDGGATVAFEAEVGGEWWSSTNGLSESGLTDARVSGLGRTCIELPPGAIPDDVTGLRIRSYDAAGTASVRSFTYAPDFTVQAFGAHVVDFAGGTTTDLD